MKKVELELTAQQLRAIILVLEAAALEDSRRSHPRSYRERPQADG